MRISLGFYDDVEFFNAVKKGNLKKVKDALENYDGGVSSNATCGQEEKPLLSFAAEVFDFFFF